MNDPRDYKVELTGREHSGANSSRAPRPYLSVHFACCSVYQRVYRNADGTAYDGRCPKCGRAVRFAIGSDGTDCRAFVVH